MHLKVLFLVLPSSLRNLTNPGTERQFYFDVYGGSSPHALALAQIDRAASAGACAVTLDDGAGSEAAAGEATRRLEAALLLVRVQTGRRGVEWPDEQSHDAVVPDRLCEPCTGRERGMCFAIVHPILDLVRYALRIEKRPPVPGGDGVAVISALSMTPEPTAAARELRQLSPRHDLPPHVHAGRLPVARDA